MRERIGGNGNDGLGDVLKRLVHRMVRNTLLKAPAARSFLYRTHRRPSLTSRVPWRADGRRPRSGLNRPKRRKIPLPRAQRSQKLRLGNEQALRTHQALAEIAQQIALAEQVFGAG